MTVRIRRGWQWAEEVPAEPTGVSGLAITFDPYYQNWSLTHTRSGYSILKAIDKAKIKRAAKVLAPLEDWTQSKTQLRKSKNINRTLRRIEEFAEKKGFYK